MFKDHSLTIIHVCLNFNNSTLLETFPFKSSRRTYLKCDEEEQKLCHRFLQGATSDEPKVLYIFKRLHFCRLFSLCRQKVVPWGLLLQRLISVWYRFTYVSHSKFQLADQRSSKILLTVGKIHWKICCKAALMLNTNYSTKFFLDIGSLSQTWMDQWCVK